MVFRIASLIFMQNKNEFVQSRFSDGVLNSFMYQIAHVQKFVSRWGFPTRQEMCSGLPSRLALRAHSADGRGLRRIKKK